MKVWDYMYVFTGDDKWTEVQCYEQPWWAVVRAYLYHQFVCLRSDSYVADIRCHAYNETRRTHLHTFRTEEATP